MLKNTAWNFAGGSLGTHLISMTAGLDAIWKSLEAFTRGLYENYELKSIYRVGN